MKTAYRLLLIFVIFLFTGSLAWAEIPATPGWYGIPNTEVTDYCSSPGGCGGIMAWSGGAFDTKRNQFLIFGGGHWDYSGNEVVAMSLDNLSMYRLWDACTTNPGFDSESCTDARGAQANSRHTYGGIGYAENVDKMWIIGGFLAEGGMYSSGLWYFNLSNNTWERPTYTGTFPQEVTYAGIASAYDNVTGLIFIEDHWAGWYTLDPRTSAFTHLPWNWSSNGNTAVERVLVIDPKRRKALVICDSGGIPAPRIANLNNLGAQTIYRQGESGSGTSAAVGDIPPFTESFGAEYDPDLDRIVAYNGGNNIYLLNLDTNPISWTKVTYTGSQAARSGSTGWRGRFRYSKKSKVYVGTDDVAQNTFTLRLASYGPPDTSPPTVPTGLNATPVSYPQVNLSWTASSDDVGVVGYRIFRNGVQVASSGTTSYQDTGLSASTTYTYKVAAYDGGGNQSSQSSPVSATTPAAPAPPTVPTGLQATPVSYSQINLSWNASSSSIGVAGYRIFRNGVQVGSLGTTSYQDTGLSASTTYTYTVAAYDGGGNQSSQSSPVSATTPAAPPATLNLVTAYALNEGTASNVGDASGNGNGGTIANATWTSAGKYGNALVFNGSSSTVNIPDSSSLHLTTGMTLEAWVYPTNGSSAWRDVIMKGSDEFFLLAMSNIGPPGVGSKFIGGSLLGPSPLPVNTWSHIAGTYDGATLRLYVNGVQVASRPQTGSIVTTSAALQLGGDSFFGQYFQGTIDEVRVYNRALIPAEIQTDMNNPIAGGGPPTTPPAPPSGLQVR